ncbi:hypothetical protein [Methanoregula sp. UBA64]|jgi:hypothetical protein|uniref:hypothetical protein n=1 Tax=Methanoregula sp. UBA64 TaxID=1915554 RepID=UPI0025F1C1D6|nr:hypothetical protein [Methanoregula sp. UBA64]
MNSDNAAVLTPSIQNGVSQNGVAHLSSQTSSGYVAQTPEYSCFQITGLSEIDKSSGYLGQNIADTRRVSGTITNNCGKIMGFYMEVGWYDPNGNFAYFGVPVSFIRLKPGDSAQFQFDGYPSSSKYGYIEESSGWTYKIGIGENANILK